MFHGNWANLSSVTRGHAYKGAKTHFMNCVAGIVGSLSFPALQVTFAAIDNRLRENQHELF